MCARPVGQVGQNVFLRQQGRTRRIFGNGENPPTPGPDKDSQAVVVFVLEAQCVLADAATAQAGSNAAVTWTRLTTVQIAYQAADEAGVGCGCVAIQRDGHWLTSHEGLAWLWESQPQSAGKRCQAQQRQTERAFDRREPERARLSRPLIPGEFFWHQAIQRARWPVLARLLQISDSGRGDPRQ